jgi:hypothetical protein
MAKRYEKDYNKPCGNRFKEKHFPTLNFQRFILILCECETWSVPLR